LAAVAAASEAAADLAAVARGAKVVADSAAVDRLASQVNRDKAAVADLGAAEARAVSLEQAAVAASKINW
jgi:hypothetical protein